MRSNICRSGRVANIRSAPLRLGQKICLGRKEAHIVGAAPKSARTGVGKRHRRDVIQEAPLPDWANFRQRALDIAVVEITKKTDLKISIKSLERSKDRRVTSVTFAIEEQAVQMATEPVKPRSATAARLPDLVEPMKAKLVSSMPTGGWIYKIKF